MVEKALQPRPEVKTQILLNVIGVVGPWPEADVPSVKIPHQKIELSKIRQLLSQQGFELITASRTSVNDEKLVGYSKMPLLDIFSKKLVGHLVCQEEISEHNHIK